MTIFLRYSHEFKDYNLEKLYGVLKTYELEIQKDEEIEKGQRMEQVSSPCYKNKEKERLRWLLLKHQARMLVKADRKLKRARAKLKQKMN